MKSVSKAVLKTLCYGDVFDYPLTLQELHQYLICISPTSVLELKNALKRKSNLCNQGRFYFLKGREGLVEERKRRGRYSRKKLKIARRAASWLRLIPTVRMVAVTGTLAMRNAQKEDDIDFLIATSSGFLWTTRFLVTILVELLAKRRRPSGREVKDKICLNMFLDEVHLAVPAAERDLFSAHEVVQIKVLWSRGETYEKFLAANRWVREYLANFQIPNFKACLSVGRQIQNPKSKIQSRNKVWKLKIGNLIESFFKNLQLWYMRPRQTNEVIRKGYLRFHPEDAREWVLRKYTQRIKEIKIK